MKITKVYRKMCKSNGGAKIGCVYPVMVTEKRVCWNFAKF